MFGTVAALALTLAAPFTPPALRIDGPSPGSHTGASIAGAGDVNGDGVLDIVVGSPLGTTGAPACAGTVHVLFGPFAPGTLDLHEPFHGLTITGARCRELAGTSVGAAGDVNGDGLGDIVIGAPAAGPQDEGFTTQPGRVYVVFGRRSGGTIDLGHLGKRGFVIRGRKHPVPDAFGYSVDGAGDVNGDGLDDVIVAAPGNPGFEEARQRGAAYVVYGRRSSKAVDSGKLGKRGFKIGMSGPGGLVAVSGAGDVNGDGRDDVVAGDLEGGHGRGAAYVILGRRKPHRVHLDRLGDHGFRISEQDRAADTGYAVDGGGDFNGDGLADVVITAPQGNRSGSAAAGGAFVVFGRRHPKDVDLRKLGRHGFEIRGEPRSWTGFAVAFAGRVDGDRRDDLALLEHGSLAVIFGHGPGSVRLDDPAGFGGFVIDGTIEPNQWYTDGASGGLVTAGALGGDANGDGRADVLAGDRVADHNDRPDSGSGYLFFSP